MRTSIKIDFNLLPLEKQKEIFQALLNIDSAMGVLEEKANDAFTLLDETYSELEEEHGDEHSLVSLFGSLKCHVEGIVSSFDATENFDRDERIAFTEWWEKMMGGHFK
jgi:hypothetical protein